MTIKFGTSGWRGLIARDFTFDNVRLAAEGITRYLQAERAKPGSPIADRKPVVILGYDTRFLGREFSLVVATDFAQAAMLLIAGRTIGTNRTIRFAGTWIMR